MRITSHLKSEHGSTLAYLIVIMAILIMLGAAILTTTFAGYMLKINASHDQTAQYVAEAGLNEAYAYLGEEIENAANYSRNVYIPAQLLNHPEISTSSLSESAYKNAVDAYFKKGYKAYFMMNEGLIKERLEKRLLIHPLSAYGANGETISSITATILNNFSETVDDFQIEFTTTVVKTNHLEQAVPATRAIKAVLTLGIPSYETPIAKEAKVIKKNALLDHALAADGNLYVSGGKVTIDGNATLLGHDGIDKLRLPSESGGVIVGGLPTRWDENKNPIGTVNTLSAKAGNLEVTGNLVTNKFLRIAYSTAEAPSNITVEGNVHGNSIAIQGSTNSKGSININGSASVLDDMELEASNSTINVDGSYYGFSYGNLIHDQSSSIVVNNSNFGVSGSDTSSITVGGLMGIEFPKNVSTGETRTSPENGTYLAGTIYADEDKTYTLNASGNPSNGNVTVLSNGTYLYTKSASSTGAVTDLFKVDIYREATLIETKDVSISLSETESEKYGYVEESYQTGDSVSVKGNYIAYSKVLSSTNSINTGVDPVDSTYLDLDELIHFKPFEPLLLVDKKRGNPDSSQIVNMTNVDKMKYSFFSQRQDSTDLNLGNGKIKLGNVVYTTGTFLNTSGMYKSIGDLSVQSLILDNLSNEFNYRVSCFGDPQHPDYIGEKTNLIKGGVSSWLRPGTPNIISTTGNELFFLQPNTDKRSVILKGAGDDTLFASLKTQLGDGNYVVMSCGSAVKGMIISNKDIYALGTVDYEGLLVAKQNVYFIGDGIKNFTNRDTSVSSNYITTLAIDGITASDAVKAKKIGYWFRQEEEWKEVIVDNRYVPETGVSIGATNAFDSLIKVSRWEKIDH